MLIHDETVICKVNSTPTLFPINGILLTTLSRLHCGEGK